jgi:hypothetical protein
MRKNRRTLKGKLKDLASKTKRIIFGKESNLDIDKILNPPSLEGKAGSESKAIDRGVRREPHRRTVERSCQLGG